MLHLRCFLATILGALAFAGLTSPAKSADFDQVSRICGFRVVAAIGEKSFDVGLGRAAADAAVQANKRRNTARRASECKWLLFEMSKLCREGSRFAAYNYDGVTPVTLKTACNSVIAEFKARRYKDTYPLYRFYLSRAQVENALGEYDSAIKDSTDYLREKNPVGTYFGQDVATAYHVRAIAYYSRAMYDLALSDLDTIVLRNVRDTISNSYRADIGLPEKIGADLKESGIDLDHPRNAVRGDPKLFDHVPLLNASKRGSLSTFKLDLKRALFNTNEMRGDIALAEGDYDLAVHYYEIYSEIFPNRAEGMAEKIALAKKMMDTKKTGAPLPPPQPGSPSPLPPACKMYPNLC